MGGAWLFRVRLLRIGLPRNVARASSIILLGTGLAGLF